MSFCNVLIVGGKSVGKTHIFNQIAYKSECPRSHRGSVKDTDLVSLSAEGRTITIEVRDTISSDPNSINSTLCRNLDIVLFVYSLDRAGSIDDLGHCHDTVYKYLSPDVISCLVGTKCDKSKEEKIKDDDLDPIKPVIGVKHSFKVSGTTGEGITEMIQILAREYIKKQPRQIVKVLAGPGEIRTNTDDAYCCIN